MVRPGSPVGGSHRHALLSAELHFDVSQYDAEIARAEPDRWWPAYL